MQITPLHRCVLSALTACTLAMHPLALCAEETPDPFQAAVQAAKAQDFAQAADLFEALAQAGDHDAQFNFAVLLKSGKGRPQHFVQALEWALLAQLGGVTRASTLSADLIEIVQAPALREIEGRIQERMQGRLARGDRDAVMQYVQLTREVLQKPDLEEAYLWTLLGSALGLPEAAAERDDIADELDIKTIAKVQDAARDLFVEEKMAERFAVPPADS